MAAGEPRHGVRVAGRGRREWPIGASPAQSAEELFGARRTWRAALGASAIGLCLAEKMQQIAIRQA